ncbi:MAG: glycosyltransferase family 39 protein [Elusimicrobiota bacterium]
MLGVSIFDSYGIGWDEINERACGNLIFNYLTSNDKTYLSHLNRYHGPAFEMLLTGIEKIAGLGSNFRAIFAVRHFITFLAFFTGIVFFYLLLEKKFNNWKISLLGCVFLIYTPRIFADSFYNSRDIPFLSVFIISIYTLVRFLENKSIINAILHAIASAFLFDIRIAGAIVPALTIIFTILDLINAKQKEKLTPRIRNLFLYLFLFLCLMILFWPILWKAPFLHLKNAFERMAHYPFAFGVFFMGKSFQADSLPFYYLPVWIMATVPVAYLMLFVFGIWNALKSLSRSGFYQNNKIDIIAFLWLIIPIVNVIALKPVLYDGWRHLFFVYPAMIIWTMTGLKYLFDNVKNILYRSFITGIIIIEFLHTAGFMFRNHPHQNVYFNVIARTGRVENNFELDYWGLSYRQALEYLLKTNPGKPIKIFTENWPGYANSYILREKDRARLVYVKDMQHADYFLTNFRWIKPPQPGREIYSIKVDNLKIMAIYKPSIYDKNQK